MCSNSSASIVESFVNENRLNLEEDPNTAAKALAQAAKQKDPQICRYILSSTSIDVNNRDEDFGRCALSVASANNHAATVRVLLEYKANPNVTDNEGNTSLIEAACVGNEEIVATLLDQKADPAIENMYGKSALWYAETRTIKCQKIIALLSISNKDNH